MIQLVKSVRFLSTIAVLSVFVAISIFLLLNISISFTAEQNRQRSPAASRRLGPTYESDWKKWMSTPELHRGDFKFFSPGPIYVGDDEVEGEIENVYEVKSTDKGIPDMNVVLDNNVVTLRGPNTCSGEFIVFNNELIPIDYSSYRYTNPKVTVKLKRGNEQMIIYSDPIPRAEGVELYINDLLYTESFIFYADTFKVGVSSKDPCNIMYDGAGTPQKIQRTESIVWISVVGTTLPSKRSLVKLHTGESTIWVPKDEVVTVAEDKFAELPYSENDEHAVLFHSYSDVTGIKSMGNDVTLTKSILYKCQAHSVMVKGYDAFRIEVSYSNMDTKEYLLKGDVGDYVITPLGPLKMVGQILVATNVKYARCEDARWNRVTLNPEYRPFIFGQQVGSVTPVYEGWTLTLLNNEAIKDSFWIDSTATTMNEYPQLDDSPKLLCTDRTLKKYNHDLKCQLHRLRCERKALTQTLGSILDKLSGLSREINQAIADVEYTKCLTVVIGRKEIVKSCDDTELCFEIKDTESAVCVIKIPKNKADTYTMDNVKYLKVNRSIFISPELEVFGSKVPHPDIEKLLGGSLLFRQMNALRREAANKAQRLLNHLNESVASLQTELKTTELKLKELEKSIEKINEIIRNGQSVFLEDCKRKENDVNETVQWLKTFYDEHKYKHDKYDEERYIKVVRMQNPDLSVEKGEEVGQIEKQIRIEAKKINGMIPTMNFWRQWLNNFFNSDAVCLIDKFLKQEKIFDQFKEMNQKLTDSLNELESKKRELYTKVSKN